MLQTQKVLKGTALVPEPVEFCGLSDFSMVNYLEEGLRFLLQRFVDYTLEEGVSWSSEVATQVYCVFDCLKGVGDYQKEYLIRRVKSLEEHCGLSHSGDIDLPKEPESSEEAPEEEEVSTCPLSKFEEEKQLKNEAYHFILSQGLLGEFGKWKAAHQAEEDKHTAAVEELLRIAEEEEEGSSSE